MKKKYLSILVILLTMILVIFMVKGSRNDDGYIMVKSDQEIKKEEKLADSSKIINEKELDNFISDLESKNHNEENLSNDSGEKIKKENNDIEFKNTITKEQALEEDINSIKEIDSEYQIDKSDNETKEVIFKVDKEKIISKMTSEDRKTLTRMVKKLSMYDYARMINTIKNNGEEEAALDVLEILTKRLNNEEYNKIKGILDPYINIDLLEEKSL
ncbi:hypothetical protein [Clostridium mediterraneense]|uniref:hypothetical protein n=1 Tax=Clostridium mediterraneense TaxID=1805472 RepID=UPI00082BFE43|nr:hypothetical protein [Clostridium mediterraneense]